MAKNKHFRKDVIMARVVFAILCIGLIVGIVLLGSKLVESSKKDEKPSDTQQTESQFDDSTEEETETELIVETETQEPQVVYYVKTTGNVNFRSGPTTQDTTVYGKIPTGTKCKLIEELDGWYYIEYNGQKGYVSASYAQIVEEVVTE